MNEKMNVREFSMFGDWTEEADGKGEVGGTGEAERSEGVRVVRDAEK